MLSLNQVSYQYPAHPPVLQDISFELNPGECVGLVGRNGSGKSTLFSLLSALLMPSSGSLSFDGAAYRYDKAGLARIRSRVGYIFQEADAMLLTPSVYEELSFGPLNLKLSESEVIRRIEQVSDQLGITHLHDRATYYLSGGEKKLVSLGAILTMDPEVILADEPTSFIDGVHSRLLEEKLLDLHAQGKTILVSSHDMDFIWRFAQRIIVLHQGGVIFDGSRQALFQRSDLLEEAHLNQPHLLRVSQLLQQTGQLAPDQLIYHLDELREL